VGYLRRIGMARLLYGTDSAQGDNLRPRAAWAAFRRLPLTEAEFAQVAGNAAPYFDHGRGGSRRAGRDFNPTP
jgi:hypothetical protein